MSQEHEDRTLLDPLRNLKSRGKRTASLSKIKNRWKKMTWERTDECLYGLARSFINLGIEKGDRVILMAKNRWEWSITDMALMLIGAIPVPVYPQTHPDDLDVILKKSQASWFFLENAFLARIIGPLAERIYSVPPKMILLEDDPHLPFDYVLWKEQLQKGLKPHATPSRESINQMSFEIKSHDLATLIFTSGTSGEPQMIAITHQQILSEVAESFPYVGVTAQDISLSVLPYAHILGRVEQWGHFYFGFQMAFAESIERIADNFQEVKPTIFVGVPRIFEKIHMQTLTKLALNPMHRVFESAEAILPSKLKNQLFYFAKNQLIYKPVRDIFGGELRWALSGGAAIDKQVLQFFHRAGVLILEGYGLSETTGAITVNTPFDNELGSVGKPIGDVELTINEDREILVRSHKVSKQVTDSNGWFATGDLGYLGESGHLYLTGRKKELIKTSSGKYVSPMKLESLLKTLPLVHEALVFGDGEKFCVALIFLEKDYLLSQPDWEKQLSGVPFVDWGLNKKILNHLQKEISIINSQLSNHESIRRFAIIPRLPAWSDGTLTPSLKLKRQQIFRQNIQTLRKLFS